MPSRMYRRDDRARQQTQDKTSLRELAVLAVIGTWFLGIGLVAAFFAANIGAGMLAEVTSDGTALWWLEFTALSDWLLFWVRQNLGAAVLACAATSSLVVLAWEIRAGRVSL